VVVLVQGYPAAAVGERWFKEVLLAEGPNGIMVEALDAAGNVARARIVVVLDTRPPVLEVTLTVGGRTYAAGGRAVVTKDGEARFVVVADERGTVEVTGRTAFTVEAGSVTRTYLLEEGANVFRFAMRDVAGNAGVPVEFTVELDTVAPSLIVLYPKDGTVVWEEQIQIRGITEPGAEISIEGVLPIVYVNGSFEAIFPLTLGSNSILVEVRDAANNSAKDYTQVVRMQREVLTPAEGGTGLLIGLVCLLIGFTVSFAALWIIRQNRKEMTMEARGHITGDSHRTDQSPPDGSANDADRKGGQE